MFGVHYPLALGALHDVCSCVTRAYAVYCDIFFFKKSGCRSKLLGCNFKLEDASSSPGRCFFCVFFFLHFSHLFFYVNDFCSNTVRYGHYMRVYLIRTARLALALPSLWKDRFEIRYHPVGARVPFVTRACTACNA